MVSSKKLKNMAGKNAKLKWNLHAEGRMEYEEEEEE